MLGGTGPRVFSLKAQVTAEVVGGNPFNTNSMRPTVD